MPTARDNPAGSKLNDGYRTLVTFANDPDISLWEKSVTPPGIDGGDAIETTTMHNDAYRTMAARALKTLTDGSFTAAYDPQVYEQLNSMININQLCTVHLPNGGELDFYAFLKSVEASELVEGEQPEMTCNFVPTNTHPTTGAEVAPAYYPPGSYSVGLPA